MVVGRILRELEDELCAVGLQTSLYWNGNIGFDAAPGEAERTHALNIKWADDIAVMVQHETPQELIDAIKFAMTTYIDRLASHGLLLLNNDKGKTEALVLLRGPRSRQIRRELFAQADASLTITTTGFGDLSIRLVDRYKHLGNLVHATVFE